MKSKIIMVIAVIAMMMIGSSNFAKAGTVTPFCPPNANIRLDREGSIPKTKTGSWVMINVRYNEDGSYNWGNSCCCDPGISCHEGDWFTWWMPGMIEPPVNNGCTPEVIPFVPDGYDVNTGNYLNSHGTN
ncbi:MAG: hypothetical protein ACPL1A_10005 [Candidatus Kapaibacteriota bacterium]